MRLLVKVLTKFRIENFATVKSNGLKKKQVTNKEVLNKPTFLKEKTKNPIFSGFTAFYCLFMTAKWKSLSFGLLLEQNIKIWLIVVQETCIKHCYFLAIYGPNNQSVT